MTEEQTRSEDAVPSCSKSKKQTGSEDDVPSCSESCIMIEEPPQRLNKDDSDKDDKEVT